MGSALRRWLLLTDDQRLLFVMAGVSFGVATACGGWLTMMPEADPVLGLHPAIKPAKFGAAIGVFLLSFGLLIPMLDATGLAKRRLTQVFVAAMIVEMTAIVGQAALGTTSHFNENTTFDYFVWTVMGSGILVATLGIAWAAWAATRRPLVGSDGTNLSPAMSLAWRAGLWLLLFSAASGASMGSLNTHSIGGLDGGPGLAITNWSTTHGDLRVSHFFSMHALQVLPAAAWMLTRVPLSRVASVAWVALGVLAYGTVCVGTFVQAQLGLPLLPLF